MLNPNKLKNAMRKSGNTQDYFIKKLGISPGKFYKRLSASNLEARDIVTLSEMLGVSIAYLFDEENYYKMGDGNIPVEEAAKQADHHSLEIT